MAGWIKLHRDIGEWVFKQSPKHMAVWIELLISANHQEKEFIFNERVIRLKKGQLITGRCVLANKTGLSEQNVRTILKDLEINQQISQVKTNKYSIITITNWELYQDANQQNNQQVTSSQPASNQQPTTNKKDKKVNKVKKEEKNVLSLEDWYSVLASTSDLYLNHQKVKSAVKQWYDHKLEIGEPYKTNGILTAIANKFKGKELLFPVAVNNSIQGGKNGPWTGLFVPTYGVDEEIEEQRSLMSKDSRFGF
jgi:hypothetical protein